MSDEDERPDEDDDDDDGDAADDDADDDADEDAEPPKAAEPAEAAKKKSALGSMIGLVGFLLALGAGFAVGQLINQDDPFAEVQAGPRLKVKLRGDEPQKGASEALVTIIEFADYECPYCQQASPPLMKAVAEHSSKVRVIYKHMPLPFHKAALPAAKAAWAAGQQGKFWEFHEALFISKGSLALLDTWVAEHGLDADKFKADMASPAASASIDDDMKAAGMLGINGTPAFVVNGHHYKGKRTYAQWQEIIDAELDAAAELVGKGVAVGSVYDELMKDALEQQAAPPPAAREGGPDPEQRYQVLPDGRAAMGPEDALVTIVEFSDFQCPYCARMATTAHALVEKHPDVRFVFRNLPLGMHTHARPAAKAAVAAGRQGKFWAMHDKLFAEQKAIPEAAGEDFAAWADALGLDVARFKSDYGDPAVDAEITEDMAVARRFGVRGTPGSFVNGKFVDGAMGADGFDAVIETERAAAQKLVDEGVPRSEVLAKLLGPALQRVMPKAEKAGS